MSQKLFFTRIAEVIATEARKRLQFETSVTPAEASKRMLHLIKRSTAASLATNRQWADKANSTRPRFCSAVIRGQAATIRATSPST